MLLSSSEVLSEFLKCIQGFELGMLNSFFSKFELQMLKFELNSNFVYTLLSESVKVFPSYSQPRIVL